MSTSFSSTTISKLILWSIRVTINKNKRELCHGPNTNLYHRLFQREYIIRKMQFQNAKCVILMKMWDSHPFISDLIRCWANFANDLCNIRIFNHFVRINAISQRYFKTMITAIYLCKNLPFYVSNNAIFIFIIIKYNKDNYNYY